MYSHRFEPYEYEFTKNRALLGGELGPKNGEFGVSKWFFGNISEPFNRLYTPNSIELVGEDFCRTSTEFVGYEVCQILA